MDRCRQQLIKPIVRAEGEAHLTPFRYQTKRDMDYDMEADTAWFTFGLVDYGLRYYNPKHGRFINRDPVGEAGGLNLYDAFGGDPVNRWDWLGLSPLHDGRIRVNHDEKTITLSLDVYFRSSATREQQRMFLRGADEVFGGRNIGGYTTSILINTYPRSLGRGRTIAVGFDLRRDVYGESLEGYHIDFNMRLSGRLGAANWADIVGHEILHQYGIGHYDTGNPDTDRENLMYRFRDPRASTPREILLDQLLVEGSRYVVIEEQNNGSSSRNPFSRFWSWLTGGGPEGLGVAEEFIDLSEHGVFVNSESGRFLITISEKMSSANETLARMTAPRGFGATRAGQFGLESDNRYRRLKDPLFATLQDNVSWGVMTPHAAQSMLEARQMKIEWEARNEL